MLWFCRTADLEVHPPTAGDAYLNFAPVTYHHCLSLILVELWSAGSHPVSGQGNAVSSNMGPDGCEVLQSNASPTISRRWIKLLHLIMQCKLINFST